MGSLVLELQQEVLKPDCDILIALRKAHVIAIKLRLREFDAWIQSELNGYKTDNDNLPEYRQISGTLKAWNPYNGWIPVILPDVELEKTLCTRRLSNSISDIIELCNDSEGQIGITYNADITKQLNLWSDGPIETNYMLHIGKHSLKSIIDKVTNCLLEWTLTLEENSILGENMTFNAQETASAREIPQQINHYYGTVIQGDVTDSQIVTGNNSTVNYNKEAVLQTLEKIRESLQNEEISSEDKESAIELVDELSEKIRKDKKPSIIKAAFDGVKSFAISAGAEATTALVEAAMQGLF